ncbi:MAG: PHP domain-containing protein [Thermincola sp.]|jgi:predicted metal-dependent phosphoesterase TrpH|nr:PHP domain-containing protein [Thermincola sp.]MDT3703432.1 PHP domain-containing protein [Thermincola sp.]
MKADLHVHTHYSRDCLTPLDKVLAAALRRGLGCIAITDHNEIEGALRLREKAPIKIIVGEEIRTNRGEIIGYFLTSRIKPGMSPAKTIEEIRKQGGLVCIPHPFDRLRTSKLDSDALKEIEQEIDLIEVYNARNVYDADNQKAWAYAVSGGKLFSVGTDAHWPWEIGRSYLEIADFTDSTSLKEAFVAGPASFSAELKKSGLLVHAGTKTLKLLRKFSGAFPK